MSYEGSKEFICRDGHYSRVDCWTEDLLKCRFCDAPMVYRHTIDSTNGEIEGEPGTAPGPKKQIGFDDRWHADHYGNRYAVKVPRWIPDLSEWRVVPLPAEQPPDPKP